MKLSENPFKSEYKLRQHLDSDHVEVPTFRNGKSLRSINRISWFPAKDPVEATIGNDLSVVFHVSLLIGVPILSLITILFATFVKDWQEEKPDLI